MDEVETKIIDILRRNMKSNTDMEINADTPLSALDIESLDLAVIVFDIEDTFGIEIPHDPNTAADDFQTVGAVVENVKKLIANNGASEATA